MKVDYAVCYLNGCKVSGDDDSDDHVDHVEGYVVLRIMMMVFVTTQVYGINFRTRRTPTWTLRR